LVPKFQTNSYYIPANWLVNGSHPHKTTILVGVASIFATQTLKTTTDFLTFFTAGLGRAKQHFLHPQGVPITAAAGNGPGAEVLLHLLVLDGY